MEIIKRDRIVEMGGGKIIPDPIKWTNLELAALRILYPKYKNREMSGEDLRVKFQNRSMAAINKKAWSLGMEAKRDESVNQYKMDFAQEKIGRDK